MILKENIFIEPQTLHRLSDQIPSDDFSDSKFDIDYDKEPSKILIILSTPRSGSTMLCDFLRKNHVCLAHEYFQPFEYLPLLANRWNCIHKNYVDTESYIDNLIRFRTYPNGWLGINLHGIHIETFSAMRHCFPDAKFHYIYLIRHDIIAQAVSYALAAQTGAWSHKFPSKIEPKYDYEKIHSKLFSIQHQHSIIQAFLKINQVRYQIIYYEDLRDNIVQALNQISYFSQFKFSSSISLKKQSKEINRVWMNQFSLDYLSSNSSTDQRKGIQSKIKSFLFGNNSKK
ncbi:MAG: hypothetical protein F6K16_29955 [Symploca sp. SIO2B6]|nr:hypothetical protein [Symploca sp. SIO2B6]